MDKKSNIRILVTTTLLTTIEAFLIPHLELLYNKGFQIDIAAHCDKSPSENLTKFVNQIFEVSFSRNPLSKLNSNAYKDIKIIIEQGRYDIVHTHTPVASAITRYAARKTKSIIIYTAHGFHFHKKSSVVNWVTYFLIEKYISRFTDIIITINREDYLNAKYRLRAKKVVYIPGVGFDFDKFHGNLDSNLSIDTKVTRFLSVGELNKNKNHIRVIKALSKIDGDYIYHIIGTGPYKTILERLILKLKLEDKVKLLGYCKNLHEVYSKYDIFIFPSLREGLGLAALEAMSCGLPIVTSNVHGINDYSTEGITGVKFKPNSIKSIRNAIDRILNNKSEWHTYSDNNIERSMGYSIKSVLPLISEVYSYALTNMVKQQ